MLCVRIQFLHLIGIVAAGLCNCVHFSNIVTPPAKVSIILKGMTEENMRLHIHGLDTEAIPAMDQSSPNEKRSWWR